MIQDADPGVVAVICLLASIPLSLYVLRHRSDSSSDNNAATAAHRTTSTVVEVPDAVGGVPILGNALQYKEDPTGCIREQEARVSKIFRMNLAGRRMVIVGSDADAMKQVATKPASVLSSRKAVAEIGFEYTLGAVNVYKGTDWHKRILKDYIMGANFESNFLPGIFQALSHALDEELKLAKKGEDANVSVIPDLFHMIRRVVLRATLDNFVSPMLLQEDQGLLEALMVFQDKVEDATAKAAVLPRILALPVCLWPTQKAREVLTERISRVLPLIWDKNDSQLGPWLKTYVKENTQPLEAAEHLIGLIFAAHKNPAIGASQCICFFATEMSQTEQQQATKEAKELCAQMSSASNKSSLLDKLLKARTLRACVLETLRLTAHTIGALRYAEQSVEVQATPNVSNSSSGNKKSYLIPQGDTVAIAHHSMHMQPSIWGDNAEKFSLDRPEWKSNTSDLDIPVDNYKLTTFSNGVHKCPGEKVALAIMEILLALLLERDIQIVGKLSSISFERATLAQRDGAVRVHISNRSDRNE